MKADTGGTGVPAAAELEFPCREPGCVRAFATAALRADHTIDVHGAEPTRTWSCTRAGCSATFPTRAKRDAHTDIDHRGERGEEGGAMDEQRTERCWCGREMRHRGMHKGQRAVRGAKATDAPVGGGGPVAEPPVERPAIAAVPDPEPTFEIGFTPEGALADEPTVTIELASRDAIALLSYLGDVDTGGGTVAEVAKLRAVRLYGLIFRQVVLDFVEDA